MVRAAIKARLRGYPGRVAQELLCRSRIRARPGLSCRGSWTSGFHTDEPLEPNTFVDELERVSIAIRQVPRIHALRSHDGKEFLPARIIHRAQPRCLRVTGECDSKTAHFVDRLRDQLVRHFRDVFPDRRLARRRTAIHTDRLTFASGIAKCMY